MHGLKKKKMTSEKEKKMLEVTWEDEKKRDENLNQ